MCHKGVSGSPRTALGPIIQAQYLYWRLSADGSRVVNGIVIIAASPSMNPEIPLLKGSAALDDRLAANVVDNLTDSRTV